MRQKILIIEDEPAIAENVKFALEKEGFQTVWHSMGKDVMGVLSEDTIDLVVLDIGLPDVNGMELCREIRKSHSVPVIFLTARSDEIDRVVGLEIGADDYVVKPFSPRELSARIRAVLRRSQKNQLHKSRENHSSAFRIDEERYRISYFSTELDLSRYEYNLLRICTCKLKTTKQKLSAFSKLTCSHAYRYHAM